MNTELKAGDVVELKSGGPKMTVYKTGPSLGGAFMVWCEWFNGHLKAREAFVPEALKLLP